MSGHVPVMLPEVLEALAPQADQVIVDGTFGGGGYSRAILAAAPCRVIGLDRDPDAVARGHLLAQEMPSRFTMVETQFSRLDEIDHPIDAVVLDIGVSSFQIDQAERGFSFMQDGPLDMRMGKDGPSAADVIAQLSEAELSALFHHYGEEREARRIARAIVTDRVDKPYLRTSELAGVVARVIGRKHHDGIHPATRVFQALRIYVNDEIGELEKALVAAEAILPAGGRLVVVSFHSLEDRAVKTFLAERSKAASGSRHTPTLTGPAASFDLITRKPVVASDAEIAANPRARSAKLRAAIRTCAPARPRPISGLRGVPTLDQIRRAA
ncbi:ribosomal RNA small subunit methyltransferase H [Candidatus Phycosocius bacilliformis]|uniref:Ribosomal RNA small subunit methyltransferase H n=1 Tax=Candidatus Phycosocius bacilliformis TaxID=1445552 RepID=A0A2P2EC79_9PROT|nr:16S rRNA (cytosine(1402)-N(4))-methyltransferase RsmH [Candidatus Phycosocius bacilliformis]GBF58677.1 ribosomal RNA small subunit methyltransferase H [Candidatus Phycosocius bacilliformis]